MGTHIRGESNERDKSVVRREVPVIHYDLPLVNRKLQEADTLDLMLERAPARGYVGATLVVRIGVVAISALIALAGSACQGSTPSTLVTVLWPQAGLVMNKHAPVTLPGSDAGKEVEVGKVIPHPDCPAGTH